MRSRLCEKVADAVKQRVGLADLKIDWVPIASADRLSALKQGAADLLCGLDPVSLTSRRDADFSIPHLPRRESVPSCVPMHRSP